MPEGRYASVTGLAGRVLLLSVPVTAPDPENPPDAAEGSVTLVDLATAQERKEVVALLVEAEECEDCP